MRKLFPLPKTSPCQWEDVILWPVLRVTWDLLTKKDVHYWHWRDYDGTIQLPLKIHEDSTAGGRESFFGNLLSTDLHEQVLVVQPTNFSGDYLLGYQFITGPRKKQLCTVVLKGPTALTTIPYEQVLFALTLEGEPLPIEVMEYSTKARLDKSILLI